ncbi:aminotransferase, class III [Biscogniauxia mediterranea]|nr:aminotransferase, class III [Biscogniauxia mediterranea]
MDTTWSSLDYKPSESTPEASLPSTPQSSSSVGSENDLRPVVVGGKGSYLHLADGRAILDGCGGAAVACIGYGVPEVVDVVMTQSLKLPYIPWGFFDSQIRKELSRWLLETSGGHFTKTYITCSGSEAMEGAMKLAHEYYVWKGEHQRINYISRDESYHGITLGALALGGHLTRRGPFEPLLVPNVHRIPACNPYRQQLPGESDAEFVSRKAVELEQVFLELGPDTVAAFVAEPVVGAALGCAPAVPGYFQAMKAVCDKYGALLVFDEVMCGMGRTGTLHAWEQEGVRPDIQAVGKGLAGGYQPVSAILVSGRVVTAMEARGASFTHGHTYQDHPVGCAAALKVQQLIRAGDLLANVRAQGRYLGKLLRGRLRHHPHVGDVRGRGLFWGVELVRDRASRAPFDPALQVAHRLHRAALAPPYDLALYHGQGCAGRRAGDHVMIMPAYNVTRDVVETIVDKLVAVLEEVFDGLAREEEAGKEGQ